MLCAWPSGLASLHDRACELFAQIKGGVTDYGVEHSQHFGHARYGRSYDGLFPEWCEANPIHLVGHSLGGQTVRVLQHLLDTNAFAGHRTSAAWVCSVTAINAPLNGSLAAYALGEKEEDAPAVVKFSPGHLLGCLVHLVAFLDVRLAGFDLGLDQWRLSVWKNGPAAFATLREALLERSKIVESADNAAYDATVHSMTAWNRSIATQPACFYFSFVGTGADANLLPPYPDHRNLSSLCLWLSVVVQWVLRRVFLATLAWLSARREYPHLAPYKGFDLNDFREQSDGLCSKHSQRFPVSPMGAAPAAPLPAAGQDIHPGVWYHAEHGQDHMGLVPFPPSQAFQRAFFSRLFARLRALPRPDAGKALCVESHAMANVGLQGVDLPGERACVSLPTFDTGIHVPLAAC